MHLTDSLSSWRAETFWTKEPETIAWLYHFSKIANKVLPTFVDVGSNVGIYTLYWLTLNNNTRAIACEPFEENMKLLKINLDLNFMKDRTTLISNPLYSELISGSLLNLDNRPGSSGSQFRITPVVGGIEDQITNSLTLDKILEADKGSKILKIDVDGLDYDILRGGKESLVSGEILSVLIESPESIQDQIANFLNKYNFVLDLRFQSVPNHSDVRRIALGKTERNRIYTHFDFL